MIIELEEYKYKLIGMRKDIAELHDALRIDELTKQVNEMEEKTLDPDFWGDQTNSSKILQSIKMAQFTLTLPLEKTVCTYMVFLLLKKRVCF